MLNYDLILISKQKPSPYRFFPSAKHATNSSSAPIDTIHSEAANAVSAADARARPSPSQRFAPSVPRIPLHSSSAQSELQRKAPKFNSAASRPGRHADCIEDLDIIKDYDNGKTNVDSVQPQKWRHAATMPEPLEEDELPNQDEHHMSDRSGELSNDEDDYYDDDHISLHNKGKRRHQPSASERSRFVIPRLSGPTIISQTQSTMPLPDATQKYASTRPIFKLASRSTSPPRVPPVFSPRRRGEKFLHNGLASTVRAWVMEAAQTSDINVSVTVEDCRIDDGFVFVGGQDNVAVLAGQERLIPIGTVLTIKRGWSVDIQSLGTWTVGVEWEIG